jgi:hypothetical protein
MRRVRHSLIWMILLAMLMPCHAKAPRELLVCGADEVYALNVDSANLVKVWRWKANSRWEIPSQLRRRFYYTDECKPIDGGKRVLITSSGGATALVERKTGKALFWAATPNAHSADMLPGNRIVVACAGKTNRLAVFDVGTSDKEVYRTPLVGAHGVVWDEERRVLWALGDSELRTYRLVNWESDHPSMAVQDAYRLPKGGGHDLYPVLGSSDLIVTANSLCWRFDRETRDFRPITEIKKPWSIKSISIDPVTRELAYVQAKGGNWWSENIHILPDRTINLPGAHIYKARWNVQK